MDACLELLVEELRLTEGLEKRRMPFEPLGGPSFYCAGRHLKLMVHPDGEALPPRLLARIPPDSSDGMDLYELSINRPRVEDGALGSGEGQELENGGFEQLLRSQLVADRAWVVLFAWECERVDESFSTDGVDPVIEAFRRQLTWGMETKGFAASH